MEPLTFDPNISKEDILSHIVDMAKQFGTTPDSCVPVLSPIGPGDGGRSMDFLSARDVLSYIAQFPQFKGQEAAVFNELKARLAVTQIEGDRPNLTVSVVSKIGIGDFDPYVKPAPKPINTCPIRTS